MYFFFNLFFGEWVVDFLLRMFPVYHGFKNRTGPAGLTGSTENRPSIRSGDSKKPEIALKPVNNANRPVQLENRKPERSDRFCKIAESLKQICNGAIFAVKILFFSQFC